MRKGDGFVVIVLLAACAGGCAGPSVDVTHILPAAVELPAGGEVRPDRFEVTGGGEQWISEFLRTEVQRRMAGLSGSAGAEEPLAVGGEVTVEVTDESGVRQARGYDEHGRARTVELPYLVRTVEAGVVFSIAPAGGGKAVELETHPSYVSNEDPRLRGQYGLYRGDDPDRVPPTEEIVRELLAQCVEEVRGMVEPVLVPVALQFRYAGGESSQAGLAAVEKGDFEGAVEHFSKAAEQRPDDVAVLFNLAAACEATGLLAEA
ncbi:MAG: tetratricopeptide repeat protein, partial [Phycisphaerae bacterium]